MKRPARAPAKNQILHRYYPQFSFKKRSAEERFFDFCKRNNVLGLMDEDIYCLKLTEKVRSKFLPNQVIDKDPFLNRDHLALLNAIVFFLYWKRTPGRDDFKRLIHMLQRAREQTRTGRLHTDLDVMYPRSSEKKYNHTGHREYRVFKRTRSREGAYVIIDDILQNFRTASACERLFEAARREIENR